MASLVVREFGEPQDYQTVWSAMQTFTASRLPTTLDELWLLEHQPVYTLGQAADVRHLLQPGETPVLATDRGGQVTWHGPGQLMVYTLLDTRRLGLGPKALVAGLEQAIVSLVATWGIAAHTRRDAPGIYVMQAGHEAKLAAVGLRIRKQGCYHGAAINIDCALTPYLGINPCGHAGMPVARLADLIAPMPSRDAIRTGVAQQLALVLHYDDIQPVPIP